MTSDLRYNPWLINWVNNFIAHRLCIFSIQLINDFRTKTTGSKVKHGIICTYQDNTNIRNEMYIS